MSYNELQDRLHKLIYKAAWDQESFTEAEKQEVLAAAGKTKKTTTSITQMKL